MPIHIADRSVTLIEASARAAAGRTDFHMNPNQLVAIIERLRYAEETRKTYHDALEAIARLRSGDFPAGSIDFETINPDLDLNGFVYEICRIVNRVLYNRDAGMRPIES